MKNIKGNKKGQIKKVKCLYAQQLTRQSVGYRKSAKWEAEVRGKREFGGEVGEREV